MGIIVGVGIISASRLSYGRDKASGESRCTSRESGKAPPEAPCSVLRSGSGLAAPKNDPLWAAPVDPPRRAGEVPKKQSPKNEKKTLKTTKNQKPKNQNHGIVCFVFLCTLIACWFLLVHLSFHSPATHVVLAVNSSPPLVLVCVRCSHWCLWWRCV